MTEDIAENKPGITRRKLLAGGAAASALFFLRQRLTSGNQSRSGEGQIGSSSAVQPTSTSENTSTIGVSTESRGPNQQSLDSKIAEHDFKKEDIIDGIEVYGLSESIDSADKLKQLNVNFNNAFESKFQTKALAKGLKPEEIKDNGSKREIVLGSSTERGLVVYVSRRVYDRFSGNIKGEKTNVVSWLKRHVDTMNDLIKNTYPHPDLNANLLRVIVVDDAMKKQTNDNANTNDTDGFWMMWEDYRGDTDPDTGKKTQSGYIKTETVGKDNGETIVRTTDYGLTHEWLHQVFNNMDQYVQDVADNKSNGVPALYNINGSSLDKLSPWTGFLLKHIQDLKIRGYFTDQRGMGVAAYKNVEDSVYKIYDLHPSDTSFSFKDVQGMPLEGTVEVVRLQPSGDPYGEKIPSILSTQSLQNGTIKFNQEWFSPQQNKDNLIDPMNWLLKIKSSEGKVYYLHLPISIFNVTKLAGQDKASYTVNFRDSYDPEKLKRQFFDMSTGNEKSKELDKAKQYATMAIGNTPINCSWWTDEKS